MSLVLRFLGLDDVEYVFAEGLDMGPAALVDGLASARAQIAALLPEAAPEKVES